MMQRKLKILHRENDSKDWFTFSGNMMFLMTVRVLCTVRQIKGFFNVPQNEISSAQSENENGKYYSVSYNKDYDTNITDSNTDRPYISYRKPNDVLLADYDKTILEAVFAVIKPGQNQRT